MTLKSYITILFIVFACMACNRNQTEIPNTENNKSACLKVMERHLTAVRERDLTELEKTLSPKGNMVFILPKMKPTYTTEAFVDFHKKMFEDTTWVITTNIVNSDISSKMAVILVEVKFEKPKENGEMYTDLLYTSYALSKTNTRWYVTMDHACSMK